MLRMMLKKRTRVFLLVGVVAAAGGGCLGASGALDHLDGQITALADVPARHAKGQSA